VFLDIVEVKAIEQIVNGRHSKEKRYIRSELRGGTGKEYDHEYTDASGNKVTEKRKLGMRVQSSEGGLTVKCSDVKAQGDIHIFTKGNIVAEADSYDYVADRYTKKSWGGLKKKKYERRETHVERSEEVNNIFLGVKRLGRSDVLGEGVIEIISFAG